MEHVLYWHNHIKNLVPILWYYDCLFQVNLSFMSVFVVFCLVLYPTLADVYWEHRWHSWFCVGCSFCQSHFRQTEQRNSELLKAMWLKTTGCVFDSASLCPHVYFRISLVMHVCHHVAAIWITQFPTSSFLSKRRRRGWSMKSAQLSKAR